MHARTQTGFLRASWSTHREREKKKQKNGNATTLFYPEEWRENSMTKITHTNPKEGYPVAGFSQVITIEAPAKILYLSGQVSKNQKGDVVGKGDFEAQTRQVYQNLAALLKASGASFGDVVKQN